MATFTAPSYPTPADDAITAGINAVAPTWGGDAHLGAGRYALTSGVVSNVQGVNFSGEGQPGICSQLAKGATQLVVSDGVTGLSFGAGQTHQTLGYGLRRLHIYAAGPQGNGVGVKITNAEQNILEDLTVSDFVNGTAVLIDGLGSGGNAQYTDARNLNIGYSLIGLHLTGVANGFRLAGGYFSGYPNSLTIRMGTGILVEDTDTFDLNGTRLQGWNTAVNIRDSNSHRVYGRFEACNTAIRIGGNAYGVKIGGNFCHCGVGVYVEAGAKHIRFEPDWLAADVEQPFVVEQPDPTIQMIAP